VIDDVCLANRQTWCKSHQCKWALKSYDVRGKRNKIVPLNMSDDTDRNVHVHFHSDDNICSWSSTYNPNHFLAISGLTCKVAPGSDGGSFNYSLIYLVLLIFPFMIMILALKKIRDAYARRQAQAVEVVGSPVTFTTTGQPGQDYNAVPLYDMNALPHPSQVQIFPEYPMMQTNHIQVDPSQTLTPVYTHTQPDNYH